MNKIGFNVLAWSAEMSGALLPILDRLKKIGYDGAEFFVGGSPEESFKLVGKHCADIGLQVTTVTVLSPDENPISPDVKVREKSKELYRSCQRLTVHRSKLPHRQEGLGCHTHPLAPRYH